jgi:hypothetical protein
MAILLALAFIVFFIFIEHIAFIITQIYRFFLFLWSALLLIAKFLLQKYLGTYLDHCKKYIDPIRHLLKNIKAGNEITIEANGNITIKKRGKARRTRYTITFKSTMSPEDFIRLEIASKETASRAGLRSIDPFEMLDLKTQLFYCIIYGKLEKLLLPHA